MHIRSIDITAPITAPTGEVIRELMGEAAGGAVAHSLAHITLPPGAGSARHYHPTAEESYYILGGHARVTLDGQTARLEPGAAVAIPAGCIHQIVNDGPDPLIFLAVCAPPWTPDCSVYLD